MTRTDDLSELKRKVEANSRTFIPNRDIILSLIARVETAEARVKRFEEVLYKVASLHLRDSNGGRDNFCPEGHDAAAAVHAAREALTSPQPHSPEHPSPKS